MNIQWLHELTFYVLYAALAITSFVVIERLIFYTITLRQARRLVAQDDPALDADGANLAAEVLREARSRCSTKAKRHEVEDISEALFIGAREKLQRHLWVLDTIVTAAPLLGLLGTILGIIETFSALAQSGISDPQAVSAGIGTALFATALGIATALYGLVFHNHFQDRVERIGETIKILLLEAGASLSVRARSEADAKTPATAGASLPVGGLVHEGV